MLYTNSLECYFGKTILHASFSILLFMYKGKISRRIFKVFSRNAYFTDTAVYDVADDRRQDPYKRKAIGVVTPLG